MTRRIGLVGCVKEKRATASPACELYTSTLFLGRRRYVERTCDEWWILSAEHGLVHPDDVLEPYDMTLNNMSRAEKRAWSRRVLSKIHDRIEPNTGDIFELHAGAEYRDWGLVDGLQRRDCSVEVPTEGMPIGRQLQFYARS